MRRDIEMIQESATEERNVCVWLVAWKLLCPGPRATAPTGEIMTKKAQTLRSGENGFTLVELLIVIAIIGILSAIAIPQLLGAREKSRHAACQTALHTLDGDVVNRMEYYEGVGDPAAADKAIDDVIQLTQVQPQIQNPRNMGETPIDPGYEKVVSTSFVPTADTTCKVFLYDATSTVTPASPTVVLTQYELRVRSYRVSLH